MGLCDMLYSPWPLLAKKKKSTAWLKKWTSVESLVQVHSWPWCDIDASARLKCRTKLAKRDKDEVSRHLRCCPQVAQRGEAGHSRLSFIKNKNEHHRQHSQGEAWQTNVKTASGMLMKSTFSLNAAVQNRQILWANTAIMRNKALLA